MMTKEHELELRLFAAHAENAKLNERIKELEAERVLDGKWIKQLHDKLENDDCLKGDTP
jgi:hypothetical protein